MSERIRDTQRSKVYAAERRAFPKEGRLFGHREMTLDEMQALVDKWGASKLVQRRYPRAAERCEVVRGRGASYCREHGFLHMGPRGMELLPAQIKMPRWALAKRWVLVHEYAHHLTSEVGAAHGWEFCECYLYLTRVVLGKSAEEALRREFKIGKVRHRRPRTRSMTPEQRQAARERLQGLRLAGRI